MRNTKCGVTCTHYFCKDAADTPHIYCHGVVLRAQEELRGTVPQRHHLHTTKAERTSHCEDTQRVCVIAGDLMCVCPNRHSKGSGQPKVS